MSAYEEYVAAVAALGQAITDADHAAAQAQRVKAAKVKDYDGHLEARIHGIREQAAALVSDYRAAAARLQSNAASGIGLQLPESVRPTSGASSAADAVRRQNQAASALERAVGDYEATVLREAKSASDAAAALAARRAALVKDAPPPAPEPVEAERRRIGSLKGLPLMWLVLAVPLVPAGALAVHSAVGACAGAGIALVIAFLLVGLGRVTIGSLWAKQVRKTRGTQSRTGRAPGGPLEHAEEDDQEHAAGN